MDFVRNLVHVRQMAEVEICEAKTRLSELLERVAAGEEIIIARGGRPVARLVPIEPAARRIFGIDRGLFEVPADFDAPLPADLLAAFNGEAG